MSLADQFKIRCSAISQIMAAGTPAGLTDKEQKEYDDLTLCADGKLLTATGKVATFTVKRKARLAELESLKDRKAELPAGAKTFAKNWLHDRIYRRRREFSAETTEKGNRTEDLAFDMIEGYLQDPFLRRHPDRVNGEYITGQCDLTSPTVLFDAKAAFDHTTMPLLDAKVKREHWCQLQGYGYLYGYQRLALAYVLTDMPEDMIEKKAYYSTRAKYGPDFTQDEYQDELERLTKKYTYSDLPLALRVHITEFDYDPDFIASVIDRVKEIREYLRGLIEQLPEYVKETINQPETAQKEAA